MSNPSRKYLRRKIQQDRNARLRQAQAERKMMATKQKPVADASQIEERPFSEAEMELFNNKHAEYQKAANAVNELMAFLKKQHGIRNNEGWELGQRGFIRRIESKAPPPPAKADKEKIGKTGKAKESKPVVPPPAPIDHSDGSGELVHENGASPNGVQPRL